MKNITLQATMVVILGISLFTSDSSAAPPGGGGGGGGCVTCSCTVTGTIGNKTCYCPRVAWGGSHCNIHYTPGWGDDCTVLLGPCTQAISGFAP